MRGWAEKREGTNKRRKGKKKRKKKKRIDEKLQAK
jgi:hypothetical protein